MNYPEAEPRGILLINGKMGKLIVAVTGASGSIYARKTLQALCGGGEWDEIALIVSRNGEEVAAWERETLPDSDPRIRKYDVDDMFAPPASGSADYDAMIIVPCSMGTAGRIASGVSSDLIGRAADVMLKERRPLIAVIREAPLSTIHLRNLTTLSECGAAILPAAPSFYSHPQDIEALCDTVVERIMKLVGNGGERYRWGSEK